MDEMREREEEKEGEASGWQSRERATSRVVVLVDFMADQPALIGRFAENVVHSLSPSSIQSFLFDIRPRGDVDRSMQLAGDAPNDQIARKELENARCFRFRVYSVLVIALVRRAIVGAFLKKTNENTRSAPRAATSP